MQYTPFAACALLTFPYPSTLYLPCLDPAPFLSHHLACILLSTSWDIPSWPMFLNVVLVLPCKNASIIAWECTNMVMHYFVCLFCTISCRFYFVSCLVFGYTQQEQLVQAIVCSGIITIYVSLAHSNFALNCHTLFTQLVTASLAHFGSLAAKR